MGAGLFVGAGAIRGGEGYSWGRELFAIDKIFDGFIFDTVVRVSI